MQNINNKPQHKEDKITKIIDKVLKQVFGEKAAHLIYKHLEKKYSVKPNEISEKIDLFSRGLEEFLTSGAHVVERKILDDIYSNYGLLRRLELERVQEKTDFVSQMRILMQEA